MLRRLPYPRVVFVRSGVSRAAFVLIVVSTSAWADRAGAAEDAAPPLFHLDDASLPDPIRTPGDVEKKPDGLCKDAGPQPVSPAEALCDDAFADARVPEDRRYQYECAFVIPPFIGGAATWKNVWLQPALEAPMKRAVDREVAKRVCDKTMALAQAQKEIAEDWPRAYRHYLSNDVEVARLHPPTNEPRHQGVPKSPSSGAAPDKHVAPAADVLQPDILQPDVSQPNGLQRDVGGPPPMEVSVTPGGSQAQQAGNSQSPANRGTPRGAVAAQTPAAANSPVSVGDGRAQQVSRGRTSGAAGSVAGRARRR